MPQQFKILQPWLSLLLIALLGVAACTSPASPADSGQAEYIHGLTPLAVGSDTHAAPGAVVYVQIDAVGNDGGYWWYYQIADPTMVQVLDEKTFTTNEALGSSLVYIVRFKVLKAGTSTITFNDYRSWEGVSQAIATLSYTLFAY